MQTILDTIIADKKEHIIRNKAHYSISALEDLIQQHTPCRGFEKSLTASQEHKHTAIIAEIKRKSPSAGVIREDFYPHAHAEAYEKGGATCLSVLTDTLHFGGDDDYVMQARKACNLPILRKDFIIDAYQIPQARAIGADAILLIMAILDDAQVKDFIDIAKHYHLDILIEVHDSHECERALQVNPKLLGINNRNLKTFSTDLKTCINLLDMCPKDIVIVAESGIYTHQDIEYLQEHGIYSFLVGESLMRQSDIQKATYQLINGITP